MKLITWPAILTCLLVHSSYVLANESHRADSYEELMGAIQHANEQPSDTHTVLNVGTIAVPSGPPLPAIRSRITLRGGVYTPIDEGPFTLFTVASNGELTIDRSRFAEWSSGNPADVLLFNNHGSLVLDGTRIGVNLVPWTCGRSPCANSTTLLRNQETGQLTVRNSHFVDQSLTISPFEQGQPVLTNDGSALLERARFLLGKSRVTEAIVNSGTLDIVNSSFVRQNRRDLAGQPLLTAADTAQTVSVNSVFQGFPGSDCALIQSEGHNTHDAHDCGWVGLEDQTGTDTGLIWREPGDVPPDRDEPLWWRLDLIPSAASPLLDSADQDRCPSLHTFWDADGDGLDECDRGAFELRPTSLAEGGINGLFFNPDEDGHYITVFQTQDTSVLVWNTFDAEGRQAWVYGLGELVGGRSIIADAFINRSEGLTPEGLIGDVNAEPWGTLELDMTLCDYGTFVYRSVLPEFGTGQFPVRRLSVVKQLGCEDNGAL